MVRAVGCVLGDTHTHAHVNALSHTHTHQPPLYSHLRAFACRSFCRESLSLANPHEPGPTAASCIAFIMLTVFLLPLEPTPQKGV